MVWLQEGEDEAIFVVFVVINMQKNPTLAVLITAVEWEVCGSLSKSAGQIWPALYFSTHLFPI